MDATQFESFLGVYQAEVEEAILDMRTNNIISRIWAHDNTVWKPKSTEIIDRLGWLNAPEEMVKNISEIESFVAEIQGAGYTQAYLLGMGGSSLAPKFFRSTFGVKEGFPDLKVVDTTNPDAISAFDEAIDYSKALFIVSSKSGGTTETLSFFKYFYNRALLIIGAENLGAHFAAITDPGTPLEAIAKEYEFRRIFLNNPHVGGRYSALTYFGLVPAALIGLDIKGLLESAMSMVQNCRDENTTINTGIKLGAIFGVLALSGRNKLTILSSPELRYFGEWVEQLLAESTGKEGKGIVPVDREPLGMPSVYGNDRIFVYLAMADDHTLDTKMEYLLEANEPLIKIQLTDIYDCGGEFFRWEMATAIAGSVLLINPFDQPNVEAAKKLSRKMVANITNNETALPAPSFRENGIAVYTQSSCVNIRDLLKELLFDPQREDHPDFSKRYIALQVYLVQNAATDSLLNSMRLELRDSIRVATTIGYGPSYLHSTGQLHKGDSGEGLFIQIVSLFENDIPIPDNAGSEHSAISFGTLTQAESFGDWQALLDAGRQIIRFDLGTDIQNGLKKIRKDLSFVLALRRDHVLLTS